MPQKYLFFGDGDYTCLCFLYMFHCGSDRTKVETSYVIKHIKSLEHSLMLLSKNYLCLRFLSPDSCFDIAIICPSFGHGVPQRFFQAFNVSP